MKLEKKNIQDTISKAYLSETNYKGVINKLAENLSKLNSSVKEHDREETIKDYLNRFFYETYYKDRFALKENVNNIDLAILNKNTVDSQVAVIIETKSLQNTSEMITEKNLTAKSFLELVLYYMSERIIRKNIDIKHLIVTNSRDWYVFDATEFEQIFYKNKQFNKHFNDWNENKIGLKTNEWFYKEIAIPFIENSVETIIATFFQTPELSQLSKSFKLLESLIPLYKILSPEHLLKLPFANDSNTLNYTFYNELLHIIGLHEVKDGAKKIIERLPENQRNEGSLIENTIYILQINDALNNIDTEYIKNLQNQNNEELLFSVALELSITWLNRIIFLKLLESQLLNFNNQNEQFAFLNTDKIPDFEILQELFFEVLAVEPHNRRASIKDKYQHIPYLNSSLFEPTKLERSTLKINQLKHHIKLPVFAATVLKDNKGNRFVGEKSILDYIFSFLDSYDFASDNAIKLQTKNKTIINSSVLGLIFEKINGYKEGSFFTPGYITMYICRQSIRKAVIEKFKPVLKLSESSESWKELYNKIGNIQLEKASKIFNSIKICDPAVGSGHFLVSALNELIAIKSELEILTDSQGRLLRNTYCEVQNDELFTTHQGELFSYNPKDKESQRIQETIFHEKQYLIENCLFGVDINPNAVHICRLRLWIELLKSAYYTKSSDYKELETLPNIDINIKSGNSLISRFSLNGQGLSNGIQQKMQLATQKYKQQVIIYKSTADKKTKQNAENEIERIKKQFSTIVNPNDKDYLEYQKLDAAIGSAPMTFSQEDKDAWNKKLEKLIAERDKYKQKYEERLKVVYGNSFEWRFEFPEVLDENGNYKGFDVVIGNPPYLNVEQIQKTIKDYYKSNFSIFYKRTDIFALFLDFALEKLMPNGILGFIVPSIVLNNLSYKPLRNKILQNKYLNTVCYVGGAVFKEATVDTVVLLLDKYKKDTVKLINALDFENKQIEIVDTDYFKKFDNAISITSSDLSNSIYEKILAKDNLILSDYFDVFQGIVTGNNPVYIFDTEEESEKYKIEKEFLKTVLHGRDFGKWMIKNTERKILYITDDTDISTTPQTIKYLEKFKDNLEHSKSASEKSSPWYALHRPRVKENLNIKPKIIIQNTRNERLIPRLVATVDEIGVYGSQGLNFVIPATDEYSVYFLIGILNSKLIDYLFATKFLNLAIKAEYVKQIRFPKPTKKQIEKMETLTKTILRLKSKDVKANIAKYEKQIDNLVYRLYGIVKEEIKIIDDYKD